MGHAGDRGSEIGTTADREQEPATADGKREPATVDGKREPATADVMQNPATTGGEQQPITLVEVRKRAWSQLKGICTVNKVCDGDPSRFCMGQKYGEALGLGSVGKGLSFTANVKALDRITLKTRLISEHVPPDLSTTIFGQKIALPVMPSSVSGVLPSLGGCMREQEFARAILAGSHAAGTLGWIGNTCDTGQEVTGVDAVRHSGKGIPIFKPQANSRLLELIRMAADAGATAVGVDLDGVGSTNWERMGKPVFRKSPRELAELVDSTSLPFIAKGIMCPEDALLALDAGVAGIDVSNHGGRALGSTRGVADVLPRIVNAIRDARRGDTVTITAGGGVRTGFDVMKLIALGADAVLIGRDIIRAAVGGGARGVELHFDYLRSEITRGMLLTSTNSIGDINDRIIEYH